MVLKAITKLKRQNSITLKDTERLSSQIEAAIRGERLDG
jgi:hypothetical protein